MNRYGDKDVIYHMFGEGKRRYVYLGDVVMDDDDDDGHGNNKRKDDK